MRPGEDEISLSIQFKSFSFDSSTVGRHSEPPRWVGKKEEKTPTL